MNRDKCTWKDCNNIASFPLKDKLGKVWANLCEEHYEKHDDGISNAIHGTDKKSIKKMLGNWVKAHGGAKKMME